MKTLVGLLLATLAVPSFLLSADTAPALRPVSVLEGEARARVKASARVTLADVSSPGGKELDAGQRLYGPEAPAYTRAFAAMPRAVQPFANLVHTTLYRGALPAELKAALGLRVAQINGSPYVAAHMVRILKASEHGKNLLAALRGETLSGLSPADQMAIAYVAALTQKVHGLSDSEFAKGRGLYNDSEIVELTMATCFFNFFTRYAEALRLPVEPWVLDSSAPAPRTAAVELADPSVARVALLSDAEITSASTVFELSKAQNQAPGSWRLGMANSQRAMLRAPELAMAWRGFGASVREGETLGRDIKLQVSFAVSVANNCRYCTVHQVLGLRRIGVDPAKLVAMRKDDTALTPREAVAVRFARKLTAQPGELQDADYEALRSEFGELGALELVLQTCTFAFMNRFTDGLRLPSEDEAVRVYQEVYNGTWEKERALATVKGTSN